MHWLLANMKHFVIPLVMLMSVMVIVVQTVAIRRRRAGAEAPYVPAGLRAAMLVVLVLASLVFVLAR